MRIAAHPTGELLDELTRNAEAFRQPMEKILQAAPLNVGYTWVLYERDGGLPAILWKDALYFLPLDFIDDYRAHPFAHLFTQAGQVPPQDAGRPLFIVEVKDAILSKVASIVGATSSVEAYGYCIWFFLRILNFARAHYPGGTPGVSSGGARHSFHAFFGLDPASMNLQRVRLVGWND